MVLGIRGGGNSNDGHASIPSPSPIPERRQEPIRMEPVIRQEPIRMEPVRRQEPIRMEPVRRQEPIRMEPERRQEHIRNEIFQPERNNRGIHETNDGRVGDRRDHHEHHGHFFHTEIDKIKRRIKKEKNHRT